MIQLLRRQGFVYDQLPAILLAAAIFVSSSIPSITLPDLTIIASDKVLHLLAYLVLCALVHRAFARQSKFPTIAESALILSVVATVLYGLSDEFHQSFVPNRVADVFDFAADSLGAFLFWGYEVARTKLSGSRTKLV